MYRDVIVYRVITFVVVVVDVVEAEQHSDADADYTAALACSTETLVNN